MIQPLATTDLPDAITAELPLGARALVVGELNLTATTTPARAKATAEVAQAVESWTGPGVLVFNGGLFDRGGTDLADALAAHPRLVESVARFASGAGRRVIVLPGARDANLAWSEDSRRTLKERLGADCALAVELVAETSAGTRLVRVEPGNRFDRLSARRDPRDPAETPLAWHMREEMLTNVRRGQPESGAATRWLSGLEDLDDPASFPRFLASRLAYRKLGRHAWLLLLPFVAALILRLPAALWRRAHGELASAGRLGLLLAATIVELAVLAVLAVVSLRRTWEAMANVASGQQGRDPNEAPRAAARDLVTAGAAGLVTSHTSRPQLVEFGEGFYANTGCAGDTVTEVPCRVPGLGLPSVFVASRQVSWVELEAGVTLHVRLVHGQQQLGGATLLERLVAGRPASTRWRLLGSGPELRVGVVATYPHGGRHPGGERPPARVAWPRAASGEGRARRVRRLAAVFVAAAGFVSLVSALSQPVRDRLDILRQVLPIAVPEVAGALAAVGGVGLLVLARGVRRGQRRAWAVCEGILLAVAVLHIVKGVNVEETLVALVVGGFLWVNRASFSAASDLVGLRRGLATLAGALAAVLVAGMLGLRVGSLLTAGTGPSRHPIGWGRALEATAERLVGYQRVFLPTHLDRFFTPAMGAVGVCFGLALAWLALRPVIARRSAAAAGTASSAAGGGQPDRGLARAREIVERHGSGTLDYFALRSDKDFFFWGSSVVAYAVYGGACLVSPDPIGPVAEREETWRAFKAFADERGWALGVLGAGEEWLPIYRSTGMHDLYVGDEGVVRLDRFTLEGGRFKGLRQAVNRIAKYGYTISFHDPASLDPALRSELEEVMTKSRRGEVERGFSMTLGRAFDPADRGLLLAVVHGPAGGAGGGAAERGPAGGGGAERGPAVAFCQYVPAPGIGGYSLDLMRRDSGEHPNGLIDFAVVETIRYLKARNMHALGLNFATMRAVLAGEAGEGLSQKLQAWLLRRMGDSMQIESLWRFNAKYDPDWQPRYAVYDAPEHALATAVAVARAESFWELPVIGRFLVPSAEQEAAGSGASPGNGSAGEGTQSLG